MPFGTDYSAAVQHPVYCFSDLNLRQATVRTTKTGRPEVMSGQYSVVFPMTSAMGKALAVKCFTRDAPNQLRRYELIQDGLSKLRPQWATDFVFQSTGIKVGGSDYPILKMDWVDGISLITWLDAHNGDAAAIAQLAVQFDQLVKELSDARIAHGDLQHGNILVLANGKLRLVDYDGIYLPGLGLDNIPSEEFGLPEYQPPSRTAADYGPAMDRFSAWLISLSLKALAVDPTLWGQLNPGLGEYLLLNRDDFADPSSSQRMAVLYAHPKKQVRELAERICALLPLRLSTMPDLSTAPPWVPPRSNPNLSPLPPNPPPGPGLIPRPLPPLSRPPFHSPPAPAPPLAPGRPPVVIRPVRRRQGPITAAIAAGLAIVALLIYVLWPSASSPPPKYLVGDMQGHGAYITSIAFSPNGAMIASAGADDTFNWSNIDGSNAGHDGGFAGPCSAVAFTPDNSTIVAGCSTGVQAWVFGAPANGDGSGLGNAPAQINDLVFSPDHGGQADHFAVATAQGVELWPYSPNDSDDECCTTLPSSSSTVNVAYSPSGQLLAGVSMTSVNGSGRIEIWDVGTGKLLTSFADPYAIEVAFSSDGNTLAISTDTGIQFWNVTTRSLATGIKYGPLNSFGPGGALAYSPDGSILAFADGWNKIGLWSLASSKLVGSLAASVSGQGLVYSLTFSPNSMYLASGGGNQVCNGACDDPSVHLWDVSSFTQ